MTPDLLRRFSLPENTTELGNLSEIASFRDTLLEHSAVISKTWYPHKPRSIRSSSQNTFSFVAVQCGTIKSKRLPDYINARDDEFRQALSTSCGIFVEIATANIFPFVTHCRVYEW